MEVLTENALGVLMQQALLVPIVYKDQFLGVILLATAKTFPLELMNQIDIFTYSLALSLNNSLEHEELQRIAERDPLTDFYNRRAGLKIYREEFLIALPNTEATAAKQVAERLRKRIAEKVLCVSYTSTYVSVSIGCGSLKSGHSSRNRSLFR